MEQKPKKSPQKRANQVARVFVEASSLKTDPQGSYTGKTKQDGEKPVQDADDL